MPKDPWSHWCMTCGSWEACESCFNKGVVSHRHPLVTIQHIQTIPPDDFWLLYAKDEIPERGCDVCKENFQPQTELSYLLCTTCREYDVCNTCLDKRKLDIFSLSHPSCPLSSTGQQYFTRYEAEYKPEWLQQQIEKGHASRLDEMRTSAQTTSSPTSPSTTKPRSPLTTGPAWEQKAPQKPKVQRKATGGKMVTANQVLKLGISGLKLVNAIAGNGGGN